MSELDDLAWCFLGNRGSLDQVYNLAKQCKDIEGQFVECGIASGPGIAAMKRACPHKTVYGYDSFQGIQLAGPNDNEQPGVGQIIHPLDGSVNYLQSSGVTVCTKAWVIEQLVRWHFHPDDFILVEGWVQNTLQVVAPQRVALLRLDMDIYDPTLYALRFFWGRLSEGGILLIDDWNLSGVVKACGDFFKEINYSPMWITNEQNPVYLVK